MKDMLVGKELVVGLVLLDAGDDMYRRGSIRGRETLQPKSYATSFVRAVRREFRKSGGV